MTIADRFTQFLDNLRLTDTQVANGTTSRESVCRALNAQYYSSSSGTASSRYVGSWAKLTRIRPPRDVDVLFELPSAVYHRFEGRTGNKQSQLLQEIRNVLVARFPNTNIRGDGPVVMVPFTGYAVELLPAFALQNGQFWIPVTRDGGKYLTADPEAEAEAIKASNEKTNGNTRDLIRMLKCWQGVCNVPIKSFWLELLAIDFLAKWQYAGKGKTYYDWMVRDFFAYMVAKAYGYLFVPGTYETIALGDAWKSKAESARDRAKKACDYENSTPACPYLALEEWQKIFGSYIQ